MIIYIKNENEYKIDDRLYIKEIGKCDCVKKAGKRYFLYCMINQRGEHLYCFSEDMDYISKPFGTKKIWLSPNAKATVQGAVKVFKNNVARAHDEFVKVTVDEIQTTLYYKHTSETSYDYLIERENSEQEKELCFYYDKTINNMIYTVQLLRYYKGKLSSGEYKKMSKILNFTDRGSINMNPIYISALKNNDLIMQLQIKLYYKEESEKDCSLLSEKLGFRILPRLSDNYNKNYIVDAKTIDKSVLEQSGYTILSSSFMTMMGDRYTRRKWKLNPYSKYAETKAEKELPAISFDKYLKLF